MTHRFAAVSVLCRIIALGLTNGSEGMFQMHSALTGFEEKLRGPGCAFRHPVKVSCHCLAD